MSPSGETPRFEFSKREPRRPEPSAVLVLNGAGVRDLSRAWALAGRHGDGRLLVAVDGGLSTCAKAGRTPDLFVGDGDSSKLPPSGMTSVVYPTDKGFSDLSGALRELRRREVGVVAIAGLLGGRLDHEWVNLLEVAAHADRFHGLVARSRRATIAITSRGFRLDLPKGRLFSLIALNGDANVSLTGARWKLTRTRLRPGSRGLSNVALETLDLDVRSGTVALIVPA